MTEPLNANPTVLDVSELPRRDDISRDFSKRNLEKSEEQLIYSKLRTLSLLSTDYEDDDEMTTDIEELSLPELSDASDSGDRPIEADSDGSRTEPIDAQEIYDLIAPISDPEHPLTLGQLAVVNLGDIKITNPTEKGQIGEVLIRITPTITHCSLATLIGLGIRVRLERCLPKRFRIVILLRKGTHQSENQVNKQLNDKERVSAACENPQLLRVISHMLSTCQ
ncbi:DEKNAAC104682 [Brettanomyces naardenensis]|uniref:DEKNAAC104682 n=1 Tax=Brettanomyces naardenensis TaxID=13370 RepID=A0A448YR86_BRENA|nr:DEKNAAC104682 [Brettanomyces naardenensis]